MKIRLEHANLQVRDVDGMIRFVRTAFPDFRIRREGKTWQGWRWVHVGSEDCYLALNEATAEAAERWVPYSGRPGLNHLGYEVDDVEALRARLTAAGYEETTVPNRHPHRTRVYFHDAEGNDWEFVEYSSDDPAQRNDYELPDLA
jgi:catechol 2,3-dioxygenase-like lactoylglutathione lyase family enzyme